jgi:uncharacterized protein YneF (UPF0154 family)
MDLGKVLYTVVVVIFAFLGALVVTKSISKWLKLDEKIKEDEKEVTK